MKSRRVRTAVPHLLDVECPEGSHAVDMNVELVNTGKLPALYEKILKHWFKTDDRKEMMRRIQRSRRVPVRCDDGSVEIVDFDTGQKIKRVSSMIADSQRGRNMNKQAVARELVRVARSLMGRGSRWHNVHGSLTMDMSDLEERDRQTYKKVVEALPPDSNPDEWSVDIEFVSSGYYDPGHPYGPPDSASPPDGEDEREPHEIVLKRLRSPHEKVKLHGSLEKDVFEAFFADVMKVEIETPYGDDRDDRDDDY